MNFYLWIAVSCALVPLAFANPKANMFSAIVIEGKPNATTIKENVDYYKKLVGNTAADIIVLPEYGLTLNITDADQLKNISVVISDVINNTTDLGYIDKWAKSAKSLIIANLIEQDDPDYYSTTVALNGSGKILAKYRKMNLEAYESNLKSGDGVVSFKFDKIANVEIALLAGSDILYENVAQEIIQNTAANVVVYASGLRSTLPLKNSLSIQQGYSQSNGVVLLGSSLNAYDIGITGSGIFQSGSVINSTVSSDNSSQVLSGLLTISTNRTNPCDKLHPSLEAEQEKDVKNISLEFDLDGLETEIVDNSTFSQEKCSGSFCCTFDITANWKKDEIYRIGVKNGDQQACVLLACGNSTDENDCGKIPTKSLSTSYLQIIIQTSQNDRSFRPYSYNSGLKNLGAIFCQDDSHVTIGTVGAKDVVAIGIITGSGASTLHVTLGINLIALVTVLKYYFY